MTHYGVKGGFVPSGVSQRLEGERPMAQGEMNLARRKCRGHVARQGAQHGQRLAQVQCGWSRVWRQKQVLWKPGLHPIQRGDTACFNPLLNLVCKVRKRQGSKQGGCKFFSANDTVQETPRPCPPFLLFLPFMICKFSKWSWNLTGIGRGQQTELEMHTFG